MRDTLGSDQLVRDVPDIFTRPPYHQDFQAIVGVQMYMQLLFPQLPNSLHGQMLADGSNPPCKRVRLDHLIQSDRQLNKVACINIYQSASRRVRGACQASPITARIDLHSCLSSEKQCLSNALVLARVFVILIGNYTFRII
jgi:hypothetical protein